MVYSNLVALLGAVATLSVVEAHQALIDPPGNWLSGVGGNRNNPAGTIDGYAVMPPLAGGVYNYGQDQNTASFTAAFKAAGYTSLRSFIERNFRDTTTSPVAANRECGLAATGGPVQTLPADSIKWDGFSHWGPAEVWCDDVRVFQGDNVAVSHPSGVLPYDRSKCVGKSQLRTYWLGLHVPLWQVYIGCAAIGGGGSPPTNTPAPTTRPPTNGPTTTPRPPTNGPTTTPRPPTNGPTTTPRPTTGGTQSDWGQCGGVNWTGPTTCGSNATCVKYGDFYSQCVPR